MKGSWNGQQEVPVPVEYDRALMPPYPHFMYYDRVGPKFKFYNWFPNLRDLMEHYIVMHSMIKPYFGCPYPECFRELEDGKTDILGEDVHGYQNRTGLDSCWLKKQPLLLQHLAGVHACNFAGMSREQILEVYAEKTHGVGPVQLKLAKDPTRRPVPNDQCNIFPFRVWTRDLIDSYSVGWPLSTMYVSVNEPRYRVGARYDLRKMDEKYAYLREQAGTKGLPSLGRKSIMTMKSDYRTTEGIRKLYNHPPAFFGPGG
jgi:hypothetical protein